MTDTVTEIKPTLPKLGDRAGDTPAVIIDFTHVADAGDGMRAYGFVLARWDKDYEPWITWRYIQYEDGSWHAEHGTYHQSIAAAAAQYEKRIKEA